MKGFPSTFERANVNSIEEKGKGKERTMAAGQRGGSKELKEAQEEEDLAEGEQDLLEMFALRRIRT